MLLQLGVFQFSISTLAYNQISRQSSYRWGKLDIIGGYQRLQGVGLNNDTITLTGKYHRWLVYEHFNSLDDPLQELRNLAARQEPMLLVSAAGRNHGYWVIENIESTDEFIVAGVPMDTSFTITITYYGERL